MHIQIVNFNLKDLSDEDFRRACDGWAPAFGAVPGLVSKVWLANESTNTYGGVYTWVDRQAMEAYVRSDLFQAVATNPSFINIVSTDFGVLAGPGRITRELALVAH
jgi:hypothetical protein